VSVVQNKTYLEEMLTAELRKEQPHIPPVSISSDGEVAIYNVQDRYTVCASLYGHITGDQLRHQLCAEPDALPSCAKTDFFDHKPWNATTDDRHPVLSPTTNASFIANGDHGYESNGLALIAHFAEENNLAVITGTKTPGRLLSGSAFKVGHRYILGLPVAAYLTWQGRMLENNGIVPKFQADLSRDALREGRDTQLETAIEIARSM
jgi:hypothetical protein